MSGRLDHWSQQWTVRSENEYTDARFLIRWHLKSAVVWTVCNADWGVIEMKDTDFTCEQKKKTITATKLNTAI